MPKRRGVIVDDEDVLHDVLHSEQTAISLRAHREISGGLS